MPQNIFLRTNGKLLPINNSNYRFTFPAESDPILYDTVSMYKNGLKLTRNEDYTLDSNDGSVMLAIGLDEDDELLTSYYYGIMPANKEYLAEFKPETLNNISFKLPDHTTNGTLLVYVNGQLLTNDLTTAYEINEDNELVFHINLDVDDLVKISCAKKLP